MIYSLTGPVKAGNDHPVPSAPKAST
jgi:hypothetical protein